MGTERSSGEYEPGLGKTRLILIRLNNLYSGSPSQRLLELPRQWCDSGVGHDSTGGGEGDSLYVHSPLVSGVISALASSVFPPPLDYVGEESQEKTGVLFRPWGWWRLDPGFGYTVPGAP